MFDISSPDDETNSYAAIDRIVQICDQFEAELRRESQPKIEDYLNLVQPRVRNRLLRDLIAIEFEFKQRDCGVVFADYYERFPDSHKILQALLNEAQSSQRKSRKSGSGRLSTDILVSADARPPVLTSFELLDIAGSGGYGTVWRAMDLRLQRVVAVKIPRSDRSGWVDVQEVTREARVAAKLRHPNIVSVHDVGEEHDISFIVTDYINGMNLKEWKKKNAISPFDAARLVAKLAGAIQYAHDHGVIHRDLKLANVLMDIGGEPHVADFGLAKREACDDSLAIVGQVLGTPAYMAPEQARADHDSIDRRTDVYSLGVILYELLTGTTPFRGEMPLILEQILDLAPVAPRSINPNVPKDLEAICLKCLAKESARRYDSAQDLADDLHLFLNGETLRGIPAALPNRLWKWFRRNRRFIAIISCVTFLVASISSAFMAWHHQSVLPMLPRTPVLFATEPPGCEITVVQLDADTGEPDPTKIQSAPGRTPLTMSLTGGDYLVVAVLDSNRFNEVYRHVPKKDEPMAFRYPHSTWKKNASGTIELKPIPIPRPDVTVEMGFCEGSEHFAEPKTRMDIALHTWRVPSFYFDRREVSLADLQASDFVERIPENAGEGPQVALPYFLSVWYLESIGKRLPSAAELYYLTASACPDPLPGQAEPLAADDDPLSANEKCPPCVPAGKTAIDGLRSDPWEWTSTKPGGPFSSSTAIPKSDGIESLARAIGGGNTVFNPAIPTGFQVERELKHIGVRGIRSDKPRRKAKDFTTVVTNLNAR